MKSLLATLLVCSASIAATVPQSPVKPYTLIKVGLGEGERVGVLRSDFVAVETLPTPGGIVFTGPPRDAEGRPLKYAVSVAKPDSQILEYLFVEIEQTPGPGPGPGPVPPGPPDPAIPNQYGIGLTAYTEAKKLNDPQAVRTVARAFTEGASRLAALSSGDEITDINTAVKGVFAVISALPTAANWTAWRSAVSAAYKASWLAGNQTKAATVEMFLETGKALEAAAP